MPKFALHRIKPKAWLAVVSAFVLALVGLGVGVSQAAEDVPHAVSASTELYLKIEGVDGDSTTRGHEKEIVIDSYQWGDGEPAIQTQVSPTGGGGGVGRATINPFHFKKLVDKASPQLLKACASGKHFPKATLSVRKAGSGQQDYLVYELKDILVSSYQTAGQSQPTDEFSLTFDEAKMIFSSQKVDGSLGDPVESVIARNL